MAWRLEDAVVRGEIDNSIEGRTTGRVWLLGRDEPLVLDLDGDCWRDLAGTRLTFENPQPRPAEDAAEVDPDQKGIIGDMTASRKCKVPTIGEGDMQEFYDNEIEIPFEWRNTLCLEWFSRINGRVVIETSTYQLQISPHAWQMDEDEEEAQKLANLQAMRDFMAQVIRRRPADDVNDGRDEFAWEERLKESDRLTEAYQEVLEKYIDDADSERKEAFVMGWDGLLDALAERDESAGGYDFQDLGIFESPEPGDQLIDDMEDLGEVFEDDPEDENEADRHPLQRRAQELALRSVDVVPRDALRGSPAYHLVSNLFQVSGKLAGALTRRGSGFEPETGYVLAVLKRCLNWLNEVVGSCQQLMAAEQDPDQLAALAHLRSSAFEIRDAIIEMRRELKS